MIADSSLQAFLGHPSASVFERRTRYTGVILVPEILRALVAI
jgi:hypothetical protein